MSPACGTKSGYQKHTRAGEQPCAQCTEANRDYMREYRKHNNRGRRARTEHILQDLIAESRAWLAGDHPEPLVWMLNRAERRLREIGGDNDDE